MKMSPAALSLGLSATASTLGVVNAVSTGRRRGSRSVNSAKPTQHDNDNALRNIQTACADLDSKACKRNWDECKWIRREKSCNPLPTPPPTNGATAPPSASPPPPPTKAPATTDPTRAPTASPLPEGIGHCSDDAGRACWTAEACDCDGAAVSALFERRRLQEAPCACLGLATDVPTKAPTQPPTTDTDRNSPTTFSPTDGPTSPPTKSPTDGPTKGPIQSPTNRPTFGSTGSPTWDPDSDPFRFFGRIAEGFFDDNDNLEASGIDVAPDGSHLVVVADEGEIIFLNLRNYESGHCFLDSIKGIGGDDDLEGVAFDHGAWTPDDMHVYVVHEGGDDDAPRLHKVEYEYDPINGSCKASVVKSENIKGAIPCLETSNGIESLGVKRHSGNGQEAVFFVGVQDTGRVYEVTAGGESNSQDRCYDGDLGDIAGSTYSVGNGHLWGYYEDKNSIAVIDVEQSCVVATYGIGTKLDEEGLAVDWERNLLFMAVDGQDKKSVVSVYNFSYPVGVDECEESINSCGGFDLC